ncbi:MAG TPA: tyrosine recombinase XerC [Clostridiales bacterium]|jgi:site-specific recombinase XerD|nr:tyrosine recombinase XerC [Clostridiales bacterium]
MDYRSEAPEIIKGFLIYHETIKGHSRRTVEEYYLDLRTFFRFIKLEKGLVPRTAELNDISISDVDLDLVKSVTLSDVYSFLSYLSRDRVRNYRENEPEYGLNARSRARKIAAIRSFYKYLTVKAQLLDKNPVQHLDSPKTVKSLPQYLTLEECKTLLSSVDGENRERDYCILTIFLNCGLRISEVVGLNLSDISEDHIRVRGKGNKERIVYLNEACAAAINDYLALRKNIAAIDKNALFLSNRRKRISRQTVHHLVKNHIAAAGLDTNLYSSHKLRHTAATLMLKSGVDIRTLQEVLGHEHLNTTEIYTHIDNTELRIAASANPLGSFKAEKKRKTGDS